METLARKTIFFFLNSTSVCWLLHQHRSNCRWAPHRMHRNNQNQLLLFALSQFRPQVNGEASPRLRDRNDKKCFLLKTYRPIVGSNSQITSKDREIKPNSTDRVEVPPYTEDTKSERIHTGSIAPGLRAALRCTACHANEHTYNSKRNSSSGANNFYTHEINDTRVTWCRRWMLNDSAQHFCAGWYLLQLLMAFDWCWHCVHITAPICDGVHLSARCDSWIKAVRLMVQILEIYSLDLWIGNMCTMWSSTDMHETARRKRKTCKIKINKLCVRRHTISSVLLRMRIAANCIED